MNMKHAHVLINIYGFPERKKKKSILPAAVHIFETSTEMYIVHIVGFSQLCLSLSSTSKDNTMYIKLVPKLVAVRLSCGYATARLLRLLIRILPEARMFVSSD
jgi:hypothetical protein